MRHSKVLAKIRQDIPAFGVSLHLNSPDLFELVSLMGFDAIWLDLEHHATSIESAANLMRGARVGGSDVVTRPGKGEFMRMGRMLEIGASGIMYPRCETAAEAAEVVRWAKFAPLGERGCDASGADVPFLLNPLAPYLENANRETFLIVQIEDHKSLSNVEEIASVPGVDMLMLGPGDFSILSGIPGQFDHPLVQEAQQRVIEAAKSAGIHWAATCGSAAQAKKYVEQGARMIFYGCDLVMVKQGLDRIQAELAEFTSLPSEVGKHPNSKYYQESL